jgi:hypothetical protein
MIKINDLGKKGWNKAKKITKPIVVTINYLVYHKLMMMMIGISAF